MDDTGVDNTSMDNTMDDTGVDENGVSDGETQHPTGPTSNDDYEALGAMADADNVVCSHYPHFQLPAHQITGCNLQILGGVHSWH